MRKVLNIFEICFAQISGLHSKFEDFILHGFDGIGCRQNRVK